MSTFIIDGHVSSGYIINSIFNLKREKLRIDSVKQILRGLNHSPR